MSIKLLREICDRKCAVREVLNNQNIRKNKVVDVEMVKELGHSHRAAVRILKEIASSGCAQIKIGRGERLTRIKWNSDLDFSALDNPLETEPTDGLTNLSEHSIEELVAAIKEKLIVTKVCVEY